MECRLAMHAATYRRIYSRTCNITALQPDLEISNSSLPIGIGAPIRYLVLRGNQFSRLSSKIVSQGERGRKEKGDLRRDILRHGEWKSFSKLDSEI